MYYIGLDVHKKTISHCTKRVDGTVHAEGNLASQVCRRLNSWQTTGGMKARP
jgi:hypothetical protein